LPRVPPSSFIFEFLVATVVLKPLIRRTALAMRHRWLIALLLLSALVLVVLEMLTLAHGIGVFKQEVVLETPKPIRRVSYCVGRFDEAVKLRVEASADPRMFDRLEPAHVTGNRFTARIYTSMRFSLLRGLTGLNRVSFDPHLIVLVEYEDGTR